jgi:phenylpropionate dioxygenase-like ring-hydroxylating dioxygenase large terminal subunit
MQPLLKPFQYTDSNWYSLEQPRIFGRLWILAAVKPMLAKHRDFRSLTLAGKPVVLQNHEGVIRAFSNVCRHRMARIHTEEFGNRALVCPYHNWAYDECGRLVHTHRDPSVFGFTLEEIEDIRLLQYAVSTIGNLVFVNLSDSPIPIEMQFDEQTIKLLERYTEQMDSSFIYTRYEGAFNWKTGIENIKDALHVPCLHKSTFPSYFQVEVTGEATFHGRDTKFLPQDTSLRHATSNGGLLFAQGGDTPRHEWKKLVHRLDCQGNYLTFHLFPNVNLMIVDGSSFAIQIYNPLAAGRTEIQMMVALTKPLSEISYKPVILWEHLVSDMTVLQQDIDCLEDLQLGLESANENDFIHGAYEAGILDFQAAYLAQMQMDEKHQ